MIEADSNILPFFSIIIPVYNLENYLDECIESILKQDFVNYECILIDDGSKDVSPQICDEIVKKNSKFKVLHQKNMGASIARNNGILMAKGEYIVFLDGDDIFASNSALLNLFEILKKISLSVIYHSNQISFIDKTNLSNYDVLKESLQEYDIHSFINEIKAKPHMRLGNWGFTIKRKIILQNKLFFKENIVFEDILFIPQLLCSTNKIGINHSIFYGYRQREGSITSTTNPKLLLDILSAVNYLVELANNELILYRKNIYLYFCKRNWYSTFLRLSSMDIDKENKQKIFKRLKALSFLLCNAITVKNFFLFLSVNLLGVANTLFIRQLLERFTYPCQIKP